ncbi:MAG: hypothetical protein EBU90_01740 [Proteobacteria bacterium]|nr:hypothetical protein [Pseudomonadota bacterium]
MNDPNLYFRLLTSEISVARQGKRKGIDTRLDFDEFSKVEKGTFYLIGGETGTGKTSFVDDVFLMNGLDEYVTDGEDKNFHCLYFSMEVSKKRKLLKLAVNRLYRDGVLTPNTRKPVDIKKILSTDKPITEKGLDYIRNLQPFFKVLQEKVTISQVPRDAEGTRKIIQDFLDELLVEVEEEFYDEVLKEKTKRKVFVSRENGLPMFILIIYDHISLVKKKSAGFAKDQMDELSASFIEFRNKYDVTIAAVQQLKSKNSFTVDKQDELFPVLDDFSDSKNMQKDANVVLALFSPARYHIPAYKNYNIATLGDRYRSVYKLKDRDGIGLGDRSILYVGEAGIFAPLPANDELFSTSIESRQLLEDVLAGRNAFPKKKKDSVKGLPPLDFTDDQEGDPY